MSQFTFNIDVPIRNEWSNIDLLLTSVKYCFSAMLSDLDGCNTMAMVTGELVENAIKYGDWTGQDRSFRFQVTGEGKKARVSVENPVGDPIHAMAQVDGTLKWIATFPSAEEAYRARLLEVAASAELGTSKLGLVRIAYQASCKLKAEIEGRVLRVVADVTL